MARTKERSRSPDPADSPTLCKRLKTSHLSHSTIKTSNGIASPPHTPGDLANEAAARDRKSVSRFTEGLFDHSNIARLHKSYDSNEPYKYAMVDKLFQDDLLKNVKDECLRELSFTEKETDIYKVWVSFSPPGSP